jgi:Xaa-Pro aminopeptidase
MNKISGIGDFRDRKEFDIYYDAHKSSLLEESEWRPLIHSLRLIKNPLEIQKISKAIRVSHEAFTHIEKIIKP